MSFYRFPSSYGARYPPRSTDYYRQPDFDDEDEYYEEPRSRRGGQFVPSPFGPFDFSTRQAQAQATAAKQRHADAAQGEAIRARNEQQKRAQAQADAGAKAHSSKPQPAMTPQQATATILKAYKSSQLRDAVSKRIPSLSELHKIRGKFSNLLDQNYTESINTPLVFQTAYGDPSKLQFTAKENKPFLVLEDGLLKLLVELDGVSAFGSQEIRGMRKGIVKEIQAVLDKLDFKKKGGNVELEQEEPEAEMSIQDQVEPEDNAEEAKEGAKEEEKGIETEEPKTSSMEIGTPKPCEEDDNEEVAGVAEKEEEERLVENLELPPLEPSKIPIIRKKNRRGKGHQAKHAHPAPLKSAETQQPASQPHHTLAPPQVPLRNRSQPPSASVTRPQDRPHPSQEFHQQSYPFSYSVPPSESQPTYYRRMPSPVPQLPPGYFYDPYGNVYKRGGEGYYGMPRGRQPKVVYDPRTGGYYREEDEEEPDCRLQ